MTACGYRCDRDAGHGMIHHHPVPGPRHHDDWWILWPHNTAEFEDWDNNPWTGYLLIHDAALPLSRFDQATDHRIIEVWIRQLEKGLGR